MNLQQQLIEFVEKENLFLPGDKLLLASSGGLDSTVLAQILHVAGYDIELMHVNFQLRGEESNRDEGFVRSLGAHYKIPVHVTHFNTLAFAEKEKLSVQVAARELRYKWFREIRAGFSGRAWIITAHHLDDNIETSLMNWVKGTGIRGLRGMLPKQNNIVRPLLFARRQELELYAQQHKLEWVDDSSNSKDDYTRNFMRHQVMPLLQQVHPQATQNLADNLQRFREAGELYEQAVEQHRKSLLVLKNDEWHIPVEKLRMVKPLRTIYFELLKPFGFLSSQLNDLIRLLDSDSGKHIRSSTHQAIRHRNWLVIAPVAGSNPVLTIIDGPGEIKGADFILKISLHQQAPGKLDVANNTCFIPAKLIKFPLVLRRWKNGDYFYPLGMHRKKKLARFFIDQKLSKTQKEKQWVLEMNGKIVWLPELRLDERFKVTNDSAQVYKFEFVGGTCGKI